MGDGRVPEGAGRRPGPRHTKSPGAYGSSSHRRGQGTQVSKRRGRAQAVDHLSARNDAQLFSNPLATMTFFWLVGTMILLLPIIAPVKSVSAQPGTPVAIATPGASELEISVYFLREDFLGEPKVAAAHRTAAGATIEQTLSAAMSALIEGPTPTEQAAGLWSDIPEDTRVLAMTADADGVATVDLSSEFLTAGDTADLRTRLAQVVYTLTQVPASDCPSSGSPAIEQVRLLIDGSPAADVSEALITSEAVGRGAFEAETPPIFVETPAVGDTITSPIRVCGTANTFEAVFWLRVTWDGDGEEVILAEKQVQATSGSGTRGTFDEVVELDVAGSGPGRLVVFQQAASTGAEQFDVTEIPIEFMPE